jgi:hypothetical protein
MSSSGSLVASMLMTPHIRSFLIRILLLTGILAFGFLEGELLKKREWACATWFCGLSAFTIWIVYPMTALRIAVGATVFVLGLGLISFYYVGGTSQSKEPQA